ncbi:LapD/MoxY N-terminal periplasmic domain-containing protein [Gilvimarinus xylanilyticus]|uniref:EAL domain-containing protein n=1 Tax=Gilvimarinus xylanilyticus TaxID=2944139 RepID=A0A9X2I580_9GAMM|nr:LapD/MoxY N-terminal periplasmic domain-containing protein [Gilvimarinus xylanilyticus]MCP8899132.1 EAL domain-containing protein [Gilvimarinus xylanilyticus]
MSLIKQLWIGICLILILALGGSFFISTLTAREYLEQQLQLKNIDNATSLALSITQMEKDPVTLELLLSAQFDSGHYQSIRLLDPEGEVIVERHYQTNGNTQSVPVWFEKLLNIQVQPGIAQIQDGWHQYGSLEVISHSRYAQQELWDSSLRLLLWLLLAALVCGLIGTAVLKAITRPLGHVVRQAESIGQRHFITSAEPRTREFRKLVRSMNKLSASVKAMLEKETQKLDKLQRESQQDPTTTLANRSHFLNLLDSVIHREDTEQNFSVYLLRLMELAQLNQTMGRDQVDDILRNIGQTLQQQASETQGFAGRLNGTDFVLVSHSDLPLQESSEHLHRLIDASLPPGNAVALPLAATQIQTNEDHGKLLSRLDGLLARAEERGDRGIQIAAQVHSKQRNLQQWRESMTQALESPGVQLGQFAVRDHNGALVHWEQPVRLLLESEWQSAGFFVGWAKRLGLLAQIDWLVVNQAIKQIQQTGEPCAINVSESALCDVDFRVKVRELLRQSTVLCENLWLEFPESCAIRQLSQLKSFSAELRLLGCKVGLEHVGLEFTRIRELEGIGVDYLKVDSAIIRDCDSNTANHPFIQSLCGIGHSLGAVMIAEGVQTTAEQQTLAALNIDACTGPAIQ